MARAAATLGIHCAYLKQSSTPGFLKPVAGADASFALLACPADDHSQRNGCFRSQRSLRRR
jgi:hypothetical protein